MLSEHIYSGTPVFQERQAAVANELVAHGVSPSMAPGAALGILTRQINLQAQTMGFNDGFFLILLSFAAAAPFVLRFKRPTPAQGGAPAGGDAH